MANIDPRYIVGININDYFVDKETGLPLSGGTIEFFKDQDRAQGKLVFQLTGSPPNYTYTALSNPLDLSSVGTVINNDAPAKNVAIYYFPYDDLGNIELYYIVVKDSNGVIQLEREAWPNVEEGSDPTQSDSDVFNQLQNPQFVDVLFNPEYGVTINTGGAVENAEYEIAPKWFLRVSATSDTTIDVNRLAIPGVANVITNPPFELEIRPGGGITSLELIQRLNNNPNIWSNNFISGSAVVSSRDGLAHPISMIYRPSVGTGTTIFEDSTLSAGHSRVQGTVELGDGLNTDDGDTGYVDIVYKLASVGDIAITSTQLLDLDSNQQDVGFDEQTVNEQKALLSDYYDEIANNVPVPSLLHGWDFSVNPTQLGVPFPVDTLEAKYTWDQLICWQSADNLFSIDRPAENISLLQVEINPPAQAEQFALVQYMSTGQMLQLFNSPFSVSMETRTDRASGVSGTVSFWYTTDATLPDINDGSNLCLISAMNSNGKPTTFNGSWVEMTRNYRGSSQFFVPQSTDPNEFTKIDINGWNAATQDITENATYVAVVVGINVLPGISGSWYLKYIACTPGNQARPFAPLSHPETLKQMQYYYEKTYLQENPPGSIDIEGALYQLTDANVDEFFSSVGVKSTLISWQYRIEKRISITGTPPKITIYSPYTGEANRIGIYLYTVSSAGAFMEDTATTPFDEFFQDKSISENSSTYVPIDNIDIHLFSPITILVRTRVYLIWHATIDARYGIV